MMRAILVEDIRRAQFVPGAVEFDTTRRSMFWTCPCGCGTIGELDILKVGVDRDTLTVKTTIGILNDDGSTHWAGTLKKGEWIDDQDRDMAEPRGRVQAEDRAP